MNIKETLHTTIYQQFSYTEIKFNLNFFLINEAFAKSKKRN